MRPIVDFFRGGREPVVPPEGRDDEIEMLNETIEMLKNRATGLELTCRLLMEPGKCLAIRNAGVRETDKQHVKVFKTHHAGIFPTEQGDHFVISSPSSLRVNPKSMFSVSSYLRFDIPHDVRVRISSMPNQNEIGFNKKNKDFDVLNQTKRETYTLHLENKTDRILWIERSDPLAFMQISRVDG